MTASSTPSFSLLFYLCLIFALSDSSNCPSSPYTVSSNGVCYYFGNSTKSWNDAQQDCLNMNGNLVTVPNRDTQSFLQAQLQQNWPFWAETWIGASQALTEWKWVADNSFLRQQGCFGDPNGQLMPYRFGVDASYTPDTCAQSCSSLNLNYKYAGVEFADQASNQVICFCGNQLQFATNMPCSTRKCSANNTYYCGDVGLMLVFNIQGIPDGFAAWYSEQPNNYGGHQGCLTLSNTNSYKFGDEYCYIDSMNPRKYSYICQYNYQQADCMQNGLSYLQGKCYSTFPNTNTSWFVARSACLASGGDLLKFDSYQQYQSFVTSFFIQTSNSLWWIGSTHSPWSWIDGTMFVYTNFGTQQPFGNGTQCGALNTKNGYWWETQICQKTFNYICSIGNSVPPPAPTLSTTTTTTQTTTTPTTTTTTPTTTTTTPTTTTTTPTTTTTTPTTTTTTSTTTTTTPTTTTTQTTTTPTPTTTTTQTLATTTPTTTTTTPTTTTTTVNMPTTRTNPTTTLAAITKTILPTSATTVIVITSTTTTLGSAIKPSSTLATLATVAPPLSLSTSVAAQKSTLFTTTTRTTPAVGKVTTVSSGSSWDFNVTDNEFGRHNLTATDGGNAYKLLDKGVIAAVVISVVAILLAFTRVGIYLLQMKKVSSDDTDRFL